MQILILSEFLRLKFVLFVRISPDLLVLLLPSGNICNVLFRKWQLGFRIRAQRPWQCFYCKCPETERVFLL